LIRALEKVSRRKFSQARLRFLMERVNRQEEYFEEVRDLICSAAKTPVRMNEQVINVMNAQWHRGTEWARSPQEYDGYRARSVDMIALVKVSRR
jgi:DNA-directed RNA polymerase